MASVESELAPAFDQIRSEAGPFTSDGLNTTWRQVQELLIGREVRTAKDRLEPKLKIITTTTNLDNIPLDGASVIMFTAGAAFNVTGLVAPDPGKARIIILHTTAPSVTIKYDVTSTATNRFITNTAADQVMGLEGTKAFIYFSNRWRQIF